MPELPEVETTRSGLEPHCRGQQIKDLQFTTDQLRAPLDPSIAAQVRGKTIDKISRRGKHLLFHLANSSLALHVHLGMSGSLGIFKENEPTGPYDYVRLILANGTEVRLRDPRKFGHWGLIDVENPPKSITKLGPEPLSADFDGARLYQWSRRRNVPIKNFIMNQEVLVGVGNIYASEALFHSHILPQRPASSLTEAECEALAKEIKLVLERAIIAGGTTLKDFVSPDGHNGHFSFALDVYGKRGQPCPRCGCPIESTMIGGRSSFFCPHCQD